MNGDDGMNLNEAKLMNAAEFFVEKYNSRAERVDGSIARLDRAVTSLQLRNKEIAVAMRTHDTLEARVDLHTELLAALRRRLEALESRGTEVTG